MPRETIAVVGLGYVGLPVAVAFAKKYRTIGLDIDPRRVRELRAGNDVTGEVSAAELAASALEVTGEPAALAEATFVILAVPTPVDRDNRPDLGALTSASRTVGAHLRRGAVVVYESTVYPGVTEEICGPILEQASGMTCGRDFCLGYSPERINPGDPEHRFERIVKVVSAQDASTLERVAAVYESVVEAGVHRAPSIKVAEAAKVIENTQRDLNIALVNELALIFDRIGIRTADVLAAAGTKWNFLGFRPGLVGGHCIGVDPYYLTAKAEQLGYHPEVILAGRRINSTIGAYIAQRTVKMLARAGISPRAARVGVLGLTFKENVPDLRNSQVPRLVAELREFGVAPLVHDPLGDPAVARAEYGLELCGWEELQSLDAIVYAVAHDFYTERHGVMFARLQCHGVFVDVTSRLDPADVPGGVHYWSL